MRLYYERYAPGEDTGFSYNQYLHSRIPRDVLGKGTYGKVYRFTADKNLKYADESEYFDPPRFVELNHPMVDIAVKIFADKDDHGSVNVEMRYVDIVVGEDGEVDEVEEDRGGDLGESEIQTPKYFDDVRRSTNEPVFNYIKPPKREGSSSTIQLRVRSYNKEIIGILDTNDVMYLPRSDSYVKDCIVVITAMWKSDAEERYIALRFTVDGRIDMSSRNEDYIDVVALVNEEALEGCTYFHPQILFMNIMDESPVSAKKDLIEKTRDMGKGFMIAPAELPEDSYEKLQNLNFYQGTMLTYAMMYKEFLQRGYVYMDLKTENMVPYAFSKSPKAIHWGIADYGSLSPYDQPTGMATFPNMLQDFSDFVQSLVRFKGARYDRDLYHTTLQPNKSVMLGTWCMIVTHMCVTGTIGEHDSAGKLVYLPLSHAIFNGEFYFSLRRNQVRVLMLLDSYHRAFGHVLDVFKNFSATQPWMAHVSIVRQNLYEYNTLLPPGGDLTIYRDRFIDFASELCLEYLKTPGTRFTNTHRYLMALAIFSEYIHLILRCFRYDPAIKDPALTKYQIELIYISLSYIVFDASTVKEFEDSKLGFLGMHTTTETTETEDDFNEQTDEFLMDVFGCNKDLLDELYTATMSYWQANTPLVAGNELDDVDEEALLAENKLLESVYGFSLDDLRELMIFDEEDEEIPSDVSDDPSLPADGLPVGGLPVDGEESDLFTDEELDPEEFFSPMI